MTTSQTAVTRPAYTTFQALVELLEARGLLASATDPGEAGPLPISGVDCDSRVVEPGHLFICKGVAFKPAYLVSALEQGAVAYLCDEGHAAELHEVAPQVPALVAHDLRLAMALVSAQGWGYPDRRMSVAGITGTKGKTTVAYFLRTMLDVDEPGSGAAMLGTLETYDGVERHPSRNTTPEAPDLWRHLAHAADAGLTMVMEVSSQGLKYQRVEGLTYDVAAFLNIGIDHVSPIEHPTFEDYLASKLKIFERCRCAVVNARLDPQHAPRIMEAARAAGRVVRFALVEPGENAPDAEVWASEVTPDAGGMGFVVHTPQWSAAAHIPLGGDFNVENALAAVAMACELGLSREQILSGLSRARVPGRMDVCANADGSVVAVVDYAHNGMSVSTVMASMRASYPDRWVVAVFGATGGKGVERRHEMPQAAAPYVDHLVFTEDDPGPEPVETICQQMVEATPATTSCEVVLDRTEAIARAFELAHAAGRPALVCVLGKGHETRQLRAGGPAPMTPDGEVVRSLLGC